MRELDRIARNTARLIECHPAFRRHLEQVLLALEGERYRPRIQHAWRSVEEQAALKVKGTSKLKWGYHNATAPDGTPESLAADVLDDDHPDDTVPLLYCVRLGALARQRRLSTGVDWGLPPDLKAAIRAVMASGDQPPVGMKRGWDPTHVEWTGISVTAARSGVRPLVT